jgi:hypothetical protein
MVFHTLNHDFVALRCIAAAFPLFSGSGELLCDEQLVMAPLYSFPQPPDESVFYETIVSLPVWKSIKKDVLV